MPFIPKFVKRCPSHVNRPQSDCVVILSSSLRKGLFSLLPVFAWADVKRLSREFSNEFGRNRLFHCQLFLKGPFLLQVVLWEQNVCPGILASFLNAVWWIKICVCVRVIPAHSGHFSWFTVFFRVDDDWSVKRHGALWVIAINSSWTGLLLSFVQFWLGYCGYGKTQLRQEWIGRGELEGKLIAWSHGRQKKRLVIAVVSSSSSVPHFIPWRTHTHTHIL